MLSLSDFQLKKRREQEIDQLDILNVNFEGLYYNSGSSGKGSLSENGTLLGESFTCENRLL